MSINATSDSTLLRNKIENHLVKVDFMSQSIKCEYELLTRSYSTFIALTSRPKVCICLDGSLHPNFARFIHPMMHESRQKSQDALKNQAKTIICLSKALTEEIGNIFKESEHFLKSLQPPLFDLRILTVDERFNLERRKEFSQRMTMSAAAILNVLSLANSVGERGASRPGGRLPLFLLKIQF